MNRIACLVILALVGCSNQPERAAGDQHSPAERQARALDLEPVATLAGEWRVAGIDGEPLDAAYGLALSADEGAIWWEPGCAGKIVNYRIEGYRFEPVDVPLPPPPTPAADATPAPRPPICTVGLPARLGDVFEALRAAAIVGRTRENAVQFTGAGRSLTLYSQ